MRGNLPAPEQQLWRSLRNSQVGGYKFRRQMVIEPYICDFFCSAKGLVVEVDGDTHGAEADRRRDQELARRGFRVLRFTNSEVMSNLDGVLQTILTTLDTLPDRFTHPPTPSLEREGEL
jgi:very-short-patch-repair endonuclease